MAPSNSNRQRTEQEQSTEQRYVPITEESNVSFSDGVMVVDGIVQQPSKVEHWESSNGITTYTTVEWTSPTNPNEKRTSCNCPGWTHKKKGKPRECTHTKDMEGVSPCRRTKVESVVISSVQQAIDEIPDITDGRELRGIML